MIKTDKYSEVPISESLKSDVFWEDLEFWVKNTDFEKDFAYIKEELDRKMVYGVKEKIRKNFNLEFYLNKDKGKLEFYRSSQQQLTIIIELFNEIKLPEEPVLTYSNPGYFYIELIDDKFQLFVTKSRLLNDSTLVKLKRIELHILQLILGHNVEKNKEILLGLLKKSLKTKILNSEAKRFKMSIQDVSDIKPADVYKLVRDGKLLYFNTESLIFDVAEKLFEFYEGNVYKSRELEKLTVCVDFVEKNIEPDSIAEYMHNTNKDGVFLSSKVVDFLPNSYKKSVIGYLISSNILNKNQTYDRRFIRFVEEFSNEKYIFEFLDTLDDSDELKLYLDMLANYNSTDALNKFKLYKMFRFK